MTTESKDQSRHMSVFY